MTPFFVYGTLLPGQPNDVLWQDCIEQRKSAVLNGAQLYAFPQFPMLIEIDNLDEQVYGELIWVEQSRYSDILADLDFLEGYQPNNPDESLYLREKRPVMGDDGSQTVAWVYLGKPQFVANRSPIPSGNWVKHIELQ